MLCGATDDLGTFHGTSVEVLLCRLVCLVFDLERLAGRCVAGEESGGVVASR